MVCGAIKKKAGTFEKAAECLHRYSSNGVYYARFERQGKKIRRQDGSSAIHSAIWPRMDLSAGKCTLAGLGDRR